jgi:hypothetical protein
MTNYAKMPFNYFKINSPLDKWKRCLLYLLPSENVEFVDSVTGYHTRLIIKRFFKWRYVMEGYIQVPIGVPLEEHLEELDKQFDKFKENQNG